MIRTGTDSEGIYLAAVEMLEQSMGDARRERQRVNVGDDLAQLEKLEPKTEFARGYRDCVLYLVWLTNMMDAGVEVGPLSADEGSGIAAIRRARAHFEQEHPLCPCGTRIEYKQMLHCPGCGRER